MIRVIKGKVKAFGKYHSVGDVITGLSEQDEARLVSPEMGFAEYVEEKEAKKKKTPPKKEAPPKQEPKAEPEEERDEGAPADEKIDFNPEECIVAESPKPKKPPA